MDRSSGLDHLVE